MQPALGLLLAWLALVAGLPLQPVKPHLGEYTLVSDRAIVCDEAIPIDLLSTSLKGRVAYKVLAQTFA